MINRQLRWQPSLLVVAAYAAARGVTLPGAAAYLATWVLVAVASRFSISALGLQFAPPGSTSLDTISVILLVLPAGILASCLASRTPTLEATRSRPPHPAQLLWIGTITFVTLVTPWAMAPLLHSAIDSTAFFATWCLTIGVWFTLAFFGSAIFAATCTFGMLAVFSTPSLVPWQTNIIYNLDTTGTAVGVATVLLVTGTALQALKK